MTYRIDFRTFVQQHGTPTEWARASGLAPRAAGFILWTPDGGPESLMLAGTAVELNRRAAELKLKQENDQ